MSMAHEDSTTNWTVEQIAEFKEAFALFDKDGDGTITKNELCTVMQSLGQDPTDQDLDDMINEIDQDGNGEIDFDEFLVLMAMNTQDLTEDAIIGKGFSVFDVDDDGFITIDDLRTMMMSLGEEVDEQQLFEIMSEVDDSGTGRISLSNFKEFICQKYD